MREEQTRYSRLANLTKLINTKFDLRQVLEHVVIAISEEIVQCDSVGIYLPQGDGTFKGYVGKPEVINGMTLDMHIVDPKVDRLAREVIETKKAIYIPDTSVDNRPDKRAVESFQIKSLFALPIFYEEELYGLVYLFDYGISMKLSESEIQSVEAYVNMAAVAIRNTKEFERKEALIQEKQLLLNATRDLSLCSTMQEVLDRAFSYIAKVLNNGNIGVHLLDPVAESNFSPAKLSKESDWTEEEWKKTHSKVRVNHQEDLLFKEVIRTKEAILVPDVSVDPRPSQDACRRFGIKGVFMLPLVTMGEVLGIIAVVNLEKAGHVYTRAEMQLAESIVNATASTLSNLLRLEKQDLIIRERTLALTEKNKELEDAVHELKKLSKEKELILNSAGDGIFGLCLQGDITFSNPAGAAMLGYENKEELIGKSYKSIFKNIDPENVMNEQNLAFFMEKSKHKHEGDEQFFRKNGTSFPVEYVISSIKDGEDTTGYVVTFRDITLRKQLEAKIKYHAYHDSLTDLPNRLLFHDRLEQALSNAHFHKKKLAVMFLDLDRFKQINDTFGHSYGDRLLKQVADRLKRCMPKGVTVSRQGGDEFTIIMPNIHSSQNAINLALKILHSFDEPFLLKENEVFVKTSIGISMYPHDGSSVDSLVKKADTAMYKAKELAGNNYCFYTREMDNRTIENVQLENDLYKALDREEFEIYFQPQIDYKEMKLFGVEALLRWNHRKKGMISPEEFIPLAEETGLIIPIGEWMLKNACKQVKKWHDDGFGEFKVAVNLSALQFEQRNFVEIVKSILDETKLAPNLLGFELTENLIIKNKSLTYTTIQQLIALGITISIDDFGKGYSSLGYLKNFPIDTLKIDKSFIRDVEEDTDSSAILATIIHLGQNLKLNVIGEGVETMEEANFLLSKGCHYMQGYLFSPPLSTEEFEKSFLQRDKGLFKITR